jgi:hypothetical protein
MVHLLDRGALPLLLFPLALQGLAEHGLDQLAPFLLLLLVALTRLPVNLLDQIASVLVHGFPSCAAKYTGSARSPAARTASPHPAVRDTFSNRLTLGSGIQDLPGCEPVSGRQAAQADDHVNQEVIRSNRKN